MKTPTAMAAPQISDIAALKRAARQLTLAARAGCDPALGASLARHVLQTCPPPEAAVVAGFWPLAGEIDIKPLLHALHERGHVIVLPQTMGPGQALAFRVWLPGMVMQPEPFGTFCPTGALASPDFLFVPLLAFDRTGRRLGYGGGYYDRTLAALPGRPAIGCAFAAQELDEVPASEYDVLLDAVATERGVIVCGENPT